MFGNSGSIHNDSDGNDDGGGDDEVEAHVDGDAHGRLCCWSWLW